MSVTTVKKYKNQVEENEAVRIARNAGERAGGARRTETLRGALVAEVEEDGIGNELGIEAGDRIVLLNGRPVRDSIQIKMADATELLSMTIQQRDGQLRELEIEKDYSDSLGLNFDAELFDGVKRCVNKCPFCFVDQLPVRVKGARNLRRTLYVRDDDFRLSFLHGHYITLTNLKDDDFQRIIDEKLSPLYVSVHATDPATRIKLVGNRGGGNIMERLQFLIANGIQINAQIVLCPGINDKEQLDRSVRDLMTLWPGVESVAVVPIGLTKFMPASRGLRTVRPEEAQAILRQLKPFHAQAVERFGTRFAYASDEMYLLAGQQVPAAPFYDEFPQYANGVGTIRVFLDEVKKLGRRRPQLGVAPKITLVTGALAASSMREFAATLKQSNIADAQVAEVKNTFWGGNVACAGLLMGEEILEQLRGRDCGEFVFLPPDAVDNKQRMLDDVTLAQMSEELGSTVRSDANGPLRLAELLNRN